SPQDLAGMVVRKAAQMAQRLNVPILGVIENMSYVECPKCGEHIEVFGPSHAEEVAQHLGVSLLGRLPLDPQLARMGDTGAIERYHNPTIDAIAAKLLEMLG
ncbi:MAG: P-loop NTPase, partial [Anaerolineae bacterium]|nr:P-loop NTPase [Anaerolineae bacterium]